jgi:hypothetical protein
MCRVPLWGISGTLICAYLAHLSYGHVRAEEYAWPHDAWSIAAYGVWVLLMTGLLRESSCRREQVFFALVLLNFALGFVLAAWSNAPDSAVRNLRVVTVYSWSLAALVSLVITFSVPPGTYEGRR